MLWAEVEVLDFSPFGLTESSQYIHSVLQDTTDKQCEEFHMLTDKSPRFQAYMPFGVGSLDGIQSQIKQMVKQ